MNLIFWSISILAAFVAIIAGLSFGEPLKVGLGMLAILGLTEISRVFLLGRIFSQSPFIPLLLASAFLVSVGIGYYQPAEELETLKIELKDKSKRVDELEIMLYRDDVFVSRRQPSRLHHLLLTEDGIQSIRILGINSLGVLHKYRKDLGELLVGKRPIRLEVLMLDPRSPAFKTRRDGEELGATISNRMYEEWEATLAILSDIAFYSKQNSSYEETKERLEVRVYAQKPERSALFVKTADEEFLIKNIYTEKKGAPGTQGGSALVKASEVSGEFDEWDRNFKSLWDTATPISLDDLEDGMISRDLANIVVMSEFPLLAVEAKNVSKIYKKALTLHRQRRLDEASELYRGVLELEPARSATDQEVELARHFLPRVFVTSDERFELKDLVVVLHPREPLIAYHLVWQDDIDFLTDNDPGDHEIVWIRYNKDKKNTVERAWAYWHEKFPCSKTSVDKANRDDARINVFVQWGKHGSLLDGWEEVINVNGVPSVEELETLQFSRLQGEGRYRNDTSYAKKWPTNFEGSKEEFVNFPREVNVSDKLLGQTAMVVVTEYANAVIDQELLPYNIYPKPDWPPEDGDNRFCTPPSE